MTFVIPVQMLNHRAIGMKALEAGQLWVLFIPIKWWNGDDK